MMTIFSEWSGDGEYLLRLVVAALLGGLIGLERQSRGRSAGLRTNILVCVGSAAVIVAFQKLYATNDFGAASAIRMDPARAAAGVITGIGFLGAGTIIKSREFVRGLTTAASIWVVSTLGITLGLGEYLIAGALTIIVLITLYVLHRINLPADTYGTLVIECREDTELPDDDGLKALGLTVKHRAITLDCGAGVRTEQIRARYRDRNCPSVVLDRLSTMPGMLKLEWI
ncbi:MgtC/SapB family protein [bacterium]|nr:MgtC/SapB family protein [bacterium]